MEIRQATAQDIPEIGQLFSKVYTTKSFKDFTPEKAIEAMRWLFNRCPEVAFVAVEDGKIVGAHLAGSKPWFDGIHIVDGELFIDEKYRGQHIGLKLTQHYLNAAKKLGAVSVDGISFVPAPNSENRWDIAPQFFNLAWHEKNGFYRIDQMAVISGDIDELIQKTNERLTA